MRRLLVSAAVLAVGLGSAGAETTRVAPYAYQSVGHCQMTSLATAKALTTANCSSGSVPVSATIAEICVGTQAVRYYDDGTTPTASVGIHVPAGTCFPYSGPIPSLIFIQEAASAVIDIIFYN